MTPPKSTAGQRTVPMAEGLRRILVEHELATGRAGGLVCSPGRATPLDADKLTAPAIAAWATAGLDAITLHEARHTYASLMIAAGVQAKPLSEFMGHSSITITIDRYGHLYPGARAEAAAMLDRLLDAAAVAPDGRAAATSGARKRG